MCSPAKSGLLAPRNEGKHTLEEPWNISLNKGKEELECFGKSRVQVKCDSLTQKREINDTVNIRSNAVKIDPEVCFFWKLGMLCLETRLFEVLSVFFNWLWFLFSCFFSSYFLIIIISWTGCVLFILKGV